MRLDPIAEFLFDENVSQRIAKALHANKAPGKIFHSRTQHLDGLADQAWLERSIDKEWIVITSDRNEGTRLFTNQDAADQGARILLLGEFFDHLKVFDRARWFFMYWTKISQFGATMDKGSVYYLTATGQFRLICRGSDG